MCALGTRAQRSPPGGPNYPVPCVYAKVCVKAVVCISCRVCVHESCVAIYINGAIQYQGHRHHHSHTLTHTRTVSVPPVEGDTGGKQKGGINLLDSFLPLSDLSECLSC